LTLELLYHLRANLPGTAFSLLWVGGGIGGMEVLAR